MAIFGLINTESGSVPAQAQRALHMELGSRLSDCMSCHGATLNKTLDGLILQTGDILIVWGGDGTVCAAVSHLRRTGASILPLPGGTMNLAHKRIHGAPLDWQDALHKALASPEPISLSYGMVGDDIFFVALMLGRLTHLAEAREAVRDGEPVKAARKAMETDALLLDTAIDADIAGEHLTATAASVFLPAAPNGDRFEIGLIDPDGPLDLTNTGLSALLTDWRTADGMVFRLAPEARFRQRTASDFKALLDGEQRDVGPDITVRIEREGMLVRSARPAP